jgi:hypothetical protein
LPEAHGHIRLGNFAVSAGESIDFELTWFPSYKEVPPPLDFDAALGETTRYWSR